MTRLRDCPFCGAQIGYFDRECFACGTSPLPTPDEEKAAYDYAERYYPPYEEPSTPADFLRIKKILAARPYNQDD
jgi:hypothetical protein